MKLLNLITFFALALFLGIPSCTHAAPISSVPQMVRESDSADCGIIPLLAYCLTKFPLEKLDDSDGALELLMLSKELTDLPLEDCSEGNFSDAALEDCVSVIESYMDDDVLDEADLSAIVNERFFGKIIDGAKKAGKAAANGAKNVGEAIDRGAKNAGKAIGRGAKQAGKAIGRGAKQAGKAIGRGA